MDSDTTTIVVAVVVGLAVLALLAWLIVRARQRRELHRLEEHAKQSREVAADREAESGSIREDAAAERQRAEAAAEQARALQVEADERSARALEAEADADVALSEADSSLTDAARADDAADKRRR